MESENKYKAFYKTLDVISSCENKEQLSVANKMIKMFTLRFKDSYLNNRLMDSAVIKNQNL